ncbi:MAG: tetratricopeptide repeat protein [Armatimonadetes bacterium]|nr:tetratricopeptide repeat protein [Armatimonadota bacterium]MCX7967708.1 tetratricopeptide repeat protein [Armatimonadota bacterium]MDW8142320.1 tetratricopeptide repeat protein [Armatimonadota bacterium]
MVEKQHGKSAAEQGNPNSGQGNGDGKEEVRIVRVEKCQVERRKGDNGHIVSAVEQRTQINPRKAWYRCQLGRAFWALGRIQEALEHFEKACELMPHEPYYRLELAEAYLALNRYDEAIEQLEQTILWAPYDDYYHIRLAAAYLQAGRVEDAITAIEKAVKLSPRNASYHCLLGLLYLMRGDEESAAFHLKFRWQLDQYDLSFLRQFQKLCGYSLRLPSLH